MTALHKKLEETRDRDLKTLREKAALLAKKEEAEAALRREVKAAREKVEAAEKALREKDEALRKVEVKLESVKEFFQEMLGRPATPQRSSDPPTLKPRSFDSYRDEPHRLPNLPGRDSTPTQIPGIPQFPKNAQEKEAAERDRQFLKDIGRSLMDPGANWGD